MHKLITELAYLRTFALVRKHFDSEIQYGATFLNNVIDFYGASPRANTNKVDESFVKMMEHFGIILNKLLLYQNTIQFRSNYGKSFIVRFLLICDMAVKIVNKIKFNEYVKARIATSDGSSVPLDGAGCACGDADLPFHSENDYVVDNVNYFEKDFVKEVETKFCEVPSKMLTISDRRKFCSKLKSLKSLKYQLDIVSAAQTMDPLLVENFINCWNSFQKCFLHIVFKHFVDLSNHSFIYCIAMFLDQYVQLKIELKQYIETSEAESRQNIPYYKLKWPKI